MNGKICAAFIKFTLNELVMTFSENNVTLLKILCDYCNAKLEVRIAKQVGLNVKENFQCPECKKVYSARAFLPCRLNIYQSE
jgi:uncharacterized protein with PIN domain